MSVTERPTVSVVIAAYSSDRWGDLCDAVESISAQTYTARETIVAVDNNPELLDRVQRELPSVIGVGSDYSQGAGRARNAGSSVATGDVLAFLDDDAQADPKWLATLADTLADPSVIGAGGAIEPRWLTARPWWFPVEFDWVIGCTFRGSPTKATPVRNVIAANMAVRRDCFVALEGFHQNFGKVGTRSEPEETEFCIRAGAAWPDRRWLFIPTAAVRHSVYGPRTTARYFLRRCWEEGLGKANLADLVSGRTATSDERRYARVVLTTGALLYLGRALRGHPAALGKAAMLIAGFGFTAAGYVVRTATIRLVNGRRRIAART